jgi:hypothetical protein
VELALLTNGWGGERSRKMKLRCPSGSVVLPSQPTSFKGYANCAIAVVLMQQRVEGCVGPAPVQVEGHVKSQ